MIYAKALAMTILAAFASGANGLTMHTAAPTTRLAMHTPGRTAVRMAEEEDVLDNPFLKAINGLQEAIQDSPAAKFKKGLAKLQAGDYDQTATKAELSGLIDDNGVIMFSFTT